MRLRLTLRFLWTATLLVSIALQFSTAQTRRAILKSHTWRLVRQGDRSARFADSIAISLRFEDTTYILTGACNGGRGRYWTRGISRIGFTATTGTWRACPDASHDARVADVLHRTNRYRIHNHGGVRSLSLRRGWTVLAVFQAM